MGTEEAIVFTTGHQANVGTLGTILGPGDTVIADSGDHASILDGCLLSRAKLRPYRHGRLDKLEKMLQRAADDGGGVLVVVDGVFSMEGDVADLPAHRRALPGARRAADGRRGARRRRARRPRRRRERAARRRARRRPADGHLLEEPRVLRRLHRRHARGDRLPARLLAGVHVHRRGRARRRRRRAGGAAHRPLRRGPAAVRPRARERRVPERGPLGARLQGDRGRAHDHDRARGRRRRLEGRAAVEGALRRRASTSTSPCTRRSRRRGRCCAPA